MEITKVKVKLEGLPPGLLQHRYPMTDTDAKSTKRNQKQTKDDVESYLYRDEKGIICQPASHIIGALKKGGAKFQVPGRSKETYRSIMGSGIVVIYPDLIAHDRQEWGIYRSPVVIKKARIVRERPLLKQWSFSFVMEFDAEEVPKEVLKEVLDYAGRYVGIGDFRPQCGGPFGRFIVTQFGEGGA
jgi:hypothetical protein